MATQLERRNTARARLLAAARRATAEVGFQAASLAEIGERAQMSRGAANFHFGSKEQLLAALIQDAVGHWAELPLPFDPAGSLEAAIDAYCLPLLARPELVQLTAMLLHEVCGPSPSGRPLLAAQHQRLIAHLEGQIADAQEAGLVNADASPRDMAVVAVGAITDVIIQQAGAGDRVHAAYAELKPTLVARLTPFP